jgi:hypothetical protein
LDGQNDEHCRDKGGDGAEAFHRNMNFAPGEFQISTLPEFITILEPPPVTDAQSAVKVGVSYQIRKAKK